MAYVKRFIIILCLLLLIFNSISFAADTYVNFNSGTTNNFWQILSNIIEMRVAEATYLPYLSSIRYSTANHVSTSVQLTEEYLLREQDYYLRRLIILSEKYDDVKRILTGSRFYYIYCYVDTPPNVTFYFIPHTLSGNTYSNIDDWTIVNNKQQLRSSTHGDYNYLVSQNMTSVTSSQNLAVNIRLDTYSSNITTTTVNVPIPCLDYMPKFFEDYIFNLQGVPTESSEVSKAIEKSTDRILSTEEESISGTGVNDETTDNSPNLQNTYNSVNSAFTTRNTSTKTFVFTLPNGQNYNIVVANNLLTRLLQSYGSTFYAFYQAIFWCIFGGYVLFDFKRIINKFKGGDIDSVVSTSSPIDNVVKASIS